FKEFKLGNIEDGKIGYYIEGEEIRNYLNIKKGAFYKILKGIKKHNGQAYVIEYNNKYYVSQFGFELFLIRFRGNKYTVSDLRSDKEFKLGNIENGKIGYYIEGEKIRNYLNIKKGAFYKILKGIKKHNGQAYVIEYNNKYYVSQFGFELFLIRFRGNKNTVSDLILGKYRNKNKNSKKEVFRPKEKGIKGIESPNIIFRIKDEKVYIHTKSIAKLNNINERDLTEKC